MPRCVSQIRTDVRPGITPRGPSQRQRAGHAMIGGRQGEPEHLTAHLLDERSGGPRALHPPRGLRPAPTVCLQHRRNRSPRREAVALHEDRAARRAYPEQHRRHRPELPAPEAQLGSSAAERRRLLPRSRQRREALLADERACHPLVAQAMTQNRFPSGSASTMESASSGTPNRPFERPVRSRS